MSSSLMSPKNTIRELVLATKVAFINSFPRMVGGLYGLFWKPKSVIEKRIDLVSKGVNQFRFLQIGTNDGIINDPILKFILRDDWEGTRIEPLPAPFKTLNKLHKSNRKVKTLQTLVADTAGVMPLYHLSFSNKRWATGLSSLSKQNLEGLIEKGYIEKRARKYGDSLPPNKADWITEIELEVVEINQLIETEFGGVLHLIQIDTEGFDHVLVNALNLEKLEVQMICFEKIHVPKEALEACLTRLRNFGYQLLETDLDILAIKPKT